jgi:hypothetical protein
MLVSVGAARHNEKRESAPAQGQHQSHREGGRASFPYLGSEDGEPKERLC